jgi:hypothetical protein
MLLAGMADVGVGIQVSADESGTNLPDDRKRLVWFLINEETSNTSVSRPRCPFIRVHILIQYLDIGQVPKRGHASTDVA